MTIDYSSLRKQINDLHKKLQDKPEKDKLGYQLSVGGILNAFREADLSFDAARGLLEVKARAPKMDADNKLLLEACRDLVDALEPYRHQKQIPFAGFPEYALKKARAAIEAVEAT